MMINDEHDDDCHVADGHALVIVGVHSLGLSV